MSNDACEIGWMVRDEHLPLYKYAITCCVWRLSRPCLQVYFWHIWVQNSSGVMGASVKSSMSSSNCCFLICIQISQEAGKVIWYSHLFKNFLQFVVVHIVKGFSVVNEAEVDVLLEFCFFWLPWWLRYKSSHSAGDLGSIPGSGRSPWEGNGNPLQYSCLENSMARGAWQASACGVAKSQMWLSN